ncbi:ATP phosphoribosyltransferase regulatory subunit [Garciella nitratireducens]|uniref:ATP phosphoribosyltransferase regulatory subunit n=1 Tax=Garciella nitratireducens DSM 15102 TaxID=1121911 RepID=A0A1T4KNC9_9FIRM|nr:ATP phosphoribosyltransferase regulatory subunit [Garciella nitratireducens]SJZ43910.1 ATP phosphoribosyltransferase regulatory subunit [Garciella nitratireducens DSM 15102]
MNVKKFMPNGVEDVHFNEFQQKEDMIQKIQKLFKSFGYRQILTPTFEYYDLFYGIQGTVDLDNMIKIIDENGKILVLRPDVTTPIARMVATNYHSYTGYLKFSYVTNIFRMNHGRADIKKEFTQAGVEYLGNNKVEADGEIIALAIKSLLSCGVKNFKLDVGQINFFKGLLKEFSLAPFEEKNIRNLIERKNLPELKKVLEKIKGKQKLKDAILSIPYLYGCPKEVLKSAEKYIFNEQMEEALKNISEICYVLTDYGYKNYIDLDLGLVNRLDYYTGIVFQGYLLNYGKEILSGGRYDHLTQQYGYERPATGFGLNIDELLKAIHKDESVPNYKCCSDYLIIYPSEYRKRGLYLADRLREKRFIVETDVYTQKILSMIEDIQYKNIKKIIQIKEDNEIEIYSLNTKKMEKTTIEKLLN